MMPVDRAPRRAEQQNRAAVPGDVTQAHGIKPQGVARNSIGEVPQQPSVAAGV
jgi:hypothetical protein